MSIDDVRMSDRAVLKQIKTYQPLKFAFSRSANHPHKTASCGGMLDLFLGKTIVLTNGLDMRCKGEASIVDEEISSVRIVANVESVKAFWSE